MVAIYSHQVLTATVLAVKRFPYAALVAPLVVCTVAFHATVAALFRRPWTLTSQREAAALDARDAAKVRVYVFRMFVLCVCVCVFGGGSLALC
jgi:uncharacterized membrane protein